MELPSFRYHRDPVASGSVVESDQTCIRCGEARGWIYVGPVYAEEELDEQLCPWCIADGSAAAELDCEFADPEGIGGFGDWDPAPPEVVEEISLRTPGFNTWQSERWWTHCGDAAVFLRAVDRAGLEAAGPQAVAAIRAERGLDGEAWERFLASLRLGGGGPTAYLFECRHCQTVGGYSDFT